MPKFKKMYTIISFFFLIFLFLAVLSLRCCMRAFFSYGERGLLFVAVRGLLIVAASLVAEHGLQARGLQQLWHAGSVIVARGLSNCGSQAPERRLSSCSARAQLLHGMWDLPGPGIEPVSPSLAGGFLTTVPPREVPLLFLNGSNFCFLRGIVFCLSFKK